MKVLLRCRTILVVSMAVSLIMTGVFCTKKKNPVATDDEVPANPTITIITPIKNSTVAEGTDSVSFKAVIANSSGIDSLFINGVKFPVLQLSGDTVSLKLPLATDTSKIVVQLYYQKTKTLLDSVIVYKEAQKPTQSGMAMISGTLLQSSESTLAKRLAKKRIALNAQGVEVEVDKVLPVSGADIMVYDAEALSTSSDTVIKTDSAGNWTVELTPGVYFVFAVYFNREKLEIVTTSLPDIKAEKDKITKTDSAIAVSDQINPMLMTFLDASSSNDEHLFVGSDVPKGLPIVMSFSEPMTRASTGDSAHGIVLGSVDPDSSELTLKDTIPCKKLWGPDGKELRLIPLKPLTLKTTYRVVVPAGIKDLALNKLDNDYSGIFTVTDAVTLPPFALKTTSPADGDTISAGFALECIFTRHVDGLSLNKQFTIASGGDSAVQGFFEVKGTAARFVNKKPWMPGAQYTLTLTRGVKDLLGDSLGEASAVTFRVRPKDEFEQKAGIEGLVASAVKNFMGAYVAGDIETFSKGFHPSFELIDASPDGQITRQQLGVFLEKMRTEAEQRNRLAKYGILAPAYFYPVVNGKRYIAWKLVKGSVSVYFEDMGGNNMIGITPRIISMENVDITDSVRYINRAILYNGETLYFAPDMSKAFIDQNARENDPSMFGKLLRSGTNVVTQEVMLNLRSEFVIRNLTAVAGKDTATVMIELISEERYLDGKRPYPIKDPANPPPDVEKRVMALQTVMIFTSGKWMVLQIAAKELYSGNKETFKQENIADTSFAIKTFEATQPIEFVSPKHKSVAVTIPIKFEWSVLKKDGIGGYLFVIANEMSGGNQGLLIFTRNTNVTISANGAVSDGATILSVDPKTVNVPMPRFGARLTSFSASDSSIYVWKVIAVKDTAASAITAGTQIMVVADSDFGSHQGVGIFTLLSRMPDFVNNLVQTAVINQQQGDRFADRDGDMFPDWIEKAFATSPDDPGSFPNFTLDTDLDGYADFIEQVAGSNIEDAASKPEDKNPADNIPDRLQQRAEWRPELNVDDDKDGFPNEVELLFGTDPWNATSKPSKSIKASVPAGKYFGGIKMGDQGWKRINVTLTSDSTGNFATIDTTELQGLAKNGIDLTVKLFWNNGEWVFFVKFVDGPNSGKFIKVRMRRENLILRGAVDLADMENGGGPYIGEFIASTDSIKDFSNIGGGTIANPIITQPLDGQLNLGPPAPERMKRPESGSADMKLILSFAETGPEVSVVLDEETVTFERPFWAPGQYPALGCHAPTSTKQYRLEASLHRIGITKTASDTLALVGIIEYNRDNATGGTFRDKYDFVVLVTGVADPRKPSGTWSGWYTQPVAAVNVGPKPFVGTKDSVEAAFKRTSNKGFVMDRQQPVTISSFGLDGTIWIAKTDTVTYFIMEKTGDFASVMIKDFQNTQCVVLTSRGQGTVTQPNYQVFMGDSMKIIQALSTATGKVMAVGATSYTLMIDPATLHREPPNVTAQFQWIASEQGKPEHKVMFLAPEADRAMLIIKDTMPLVKDMGGGAVVNTVLPVFMGDSMKIATLLTSSSNKVAIIGTAQVVAIDPASLRKEPPGGGAEFRFVVSEQGNPQRLFVFLGSDNDKNVPAMKENIPLVREAVAANGGDRIPFMGLLNAITTALAASENKVMMFDAPGSAFTIDPAAIQRFQEPNDPNKVAFTVTIAEKPGATFVFMAEPQAPLKLRIMENKPVVFAK